MNHHHLLCLFLDFVLEEELKQISYCVSRRPVINGIAILKQCHFFDLIFKGIGR